MCSDVPSGVPKGLPGETSTRPHSSFLLSPQWGAPWPPHRLLPRAAVKDSLAARKRSLTAPCPPGPSPLHTPVKGVGHSLGGLLGEWHVFLCKVLCDLLIPEQSP